MTKSETRVLYIREQALGYVDELDYEFFKAIADGKEQFYILTYQHDLPYRCLWDIGA